MTASRDAASVVGICFVLFGLGTGCAWLRDHRAYFPSADDIACVSSAVEHGASTPGEVLAQCPGLVELAVDDLVHLIAGEKKAAAARKAKP